jgi:hypothetical protein
MLLIGAAYPKADKVDPAEAMFAPTAGPLTYRPCRPGPGDDRCIQLYERGVRAAYARWQRERGPEPRRREVAAVGGPLEDAGPAPRAREESRDHRCHDDDIARSGGGGEARGM